MLTVELGILNDCEIISFHNSYDTFPEEKFDALLVSIFKIEVYINPFAIILQNVHGLANTCIHPTEPEMVGVFQNGGQHKGTFNQHAVAKQV